MTSVTALLFGLALLDELVSGVAPLSAPEIERELAMSHALMAAVLFVIPGAIAFVVEPLIFLLADRYPRHWFVRGGTIAMAIGAAGAALAPGPITLALAFGVLFVAIGAASGLAQATLVDRDATARARTMAWWTLLSSIGDVGGPALIAAASAAGLTWRAAFGGAAVLLAVWAVLLCRRGFPARAGAGAEAEGEADPGILAALRDAVTDRALVLWLFALSLCDLLDEILFVFASLHARDVLGAGPVARGAMAIAYIAGGALGLVALDRLLKRRGELDLLIAACGACIVAYAAWLAAPTAWLAVALMVPVGATATPLYPLVAAQAYAARPNASGSVLAASHLFTPLGLGVALGLGAIADHAGTWIALLCLAAQPLGLGALALRVRRRRAAASPPPR